MIQVKTQEVARKRGIKSPYELAQRFANTEGKPPTGVLVLAHRLWNGTPKPTLDTIDRLLDVLGDCEVGELLVRKANRRTRRRKPPKDGRNGSG